MNKVLVVEDDPAIQQGLRDVLEFEGYEVFTASDGAAGYRMVQEAKPALVILDLMLPVISGFELCRKLRAENISIPILMLTARGEESDRVSGLDLGADDYVTKPFSVRELLARVRALIRRAQPAKFLPDEVRFDGIVVDFVRYEASRNGSPLELAPKEFGVLRLLAAKPGAVISRDVLLNEVWGYENYPSTRTVDNHIASLRAKLETDPSQPCRLLTVHGVGYKFILD